MSALFCIALAGCSPSAPTAEHDPIEVRVWGDDLTASGGILVVQTRFDHDLSVDFPNPQVDGLTLTAAGQPTQERLGGRSVITQRYKISGKKGSYEVPSLTVHAEGSELTGASLPVWIDLGVEGPSADQLADIVDPPVVWDIPWGWICGLGGVALFLLAGLAAGARKVARPKPKVEVKIPPDVRALEAWEKVQADEALSDDDRAQELSRIFREYTEEVLAFPAVSWTTTEILAHLEGMKHLPQGNIPRAKKLLRATDLVKYAEISPEGGFFETMDADLRAFVASTRPRGWTSDEAADD